MALKATLARFREQFDWQPAVEHLEALRSHKHVIVAGMGGSHLGAWLIKRYGNIPNIVIHRNYGLPFIAPDIVSDSLVILSSYSGTTEETLDAGRVALEHGLAMAIVTTGGKLLAFAREHALPHVVIPETGLEPRMALGFAMLSIARLLGDTELESSIRAAGQGTDPMAHEAEGRGIGDKLKNKIPLIYSSAQNVPIAYIWKIKFNETAKVPAFANTFPELCHNELSGFDVVDSTRALSEKMHAIFLEDVGDHPRVAERMRVAGEILAERGIPVERVRLTGENFGKAFASALLADWVTLELAEYYGVPNPETPLVAEFKKRIGQ